MGEILTFRQSTFDTIRFSQGETIGSLTAFGPDSDRKQQHYNNIHLLSEQQIIKLLLRKPQVRSDIEAELRLGANNTYYTEITEPFYTRGTGDIDVAIVPEQKPAESVALVGKKLKVDILNDGEDRLTGLQKLRKAVRQANKFIESKNRFSRVYLTIITEISAIRHDVTCVYRGLRSDTRPQQGDISRTTQAQILEFPGRVDLNSEVGILLIEVVQLAERNIEEYSTTLIRSLVPAVSVQQLEETTKKILDLKKLYSSVALSL
jgi:hypothetical protein